MTYLFTCALILFLLWFLPMSFVQEYLKSAEISCMSFIGLPLCLYSLEILLKNDN